MPDGSVGWMLFVLPPDDGVRRLPQLAAVEDPQHQNGAAVVAVLKGVRSTEHRQHDLPVLVAISERAAPLRMAR